MFFYLLKVMMILMMPRYSAFGMNSFLFLLWGFGHPTENGDKIITATGYYNNKEQDMVLQIIYYNKKEQDMVLHIIVAAAALNKHWDYHIKRSGYFRVSLIKLIKMFGKVISSLHYKKRMKIISQLLMGEMEASLLVSCVALSICLEKLLENYSFLFKKDHV
ncbi:hypothetical protein ACJX0J_037726 [Zea mays]